MKAAILGVMVVAVMSTLVFAQPKPATPTFEVASVKAAPPANGNMIRVRMGGDAGRLDYNNVTLRDCVRMAYRVKDYQITGPDWLTAERYDLVAKLPVGASRDQVPEMMQALLAERFKLSLHRETKDLPVYALVVGKGGLKIKPAEDDATPPGPPPGPGASFGPFGAGRGRVEVGLGSLDIKHMAIATFADLLSRQMDRPVVDMTELKGNYDIKLKFTPEPGMMQRGLFGAVMPPPGGAPQGGAPPPSPADGVSTAAAPSIFTAVQEQLGLKLEGRKAPIEILVIDHAEKVPTEN
jgi:uncharacterized protein (TIGR03435 family)